LAGDFPERVVFELGYVPSDRYYDILSGLDAIMLPYTPALYRSSGLIQEAMALGVSPLVVRGGSQMFEAARIGAGFVTMAKPSVSALLEGLRKFEQNYAPLREKSLGAAGQYKKYHSHSNLVDTLFHSKNSVTAEVLL
jgi:glycosyltransferase involved in cell wall biosynthesis